MFERGLLLLDVRTLFLCLSPEGSFFFRRALVVRFLDWLSLVL